VLNQATSPVATATPTKSNRTAIRIESGLSSVRIIREAATLCSIERAELLTRVNERSTLPCYP
jgi:hypothetical protein